MITATVTGNLAAKPELKNTPNGKLYARITVYSTRRVQNPTGTWVDANTTKIQCTLWGGLAEHAAVELDKGMSVIVKGTLEQREYKDKDGVQRIALEMNVLEIGRALKHSTPTNSQTAQAPQAQNTGWTQSAPSQDPWGNTETEPAF